MVVREVMLFGKPPEEAAKSPMLDLLGSGFSQSVRMVADELGWTLDPELTTGHEWAVATKDLDTPVGLIPAGTVAAQRGEYGEARERYLESLAIRERGGEQSTLSLVEFREKLATLEPWQAGAEPSLTS